MALSLQLQHYTLHHQTSTCKNCGRAYSNYTLYSVHFDPRRPQDGKHFLRVSGGVDSILDLPVHHHHEPGILIPLCGPCAADRDNLSRLPVPPPSAPFRSTLHDPKLEAWLRERTSNESGGRIISRRVSRRVSPRSRPASTDADLDF